MLRLVCCSAVLVCCLFSSCAAFGVNIPFASNPALARSPYFPSHRVRPLFCQETRLGDVFMKPCKTLCPGCEPWICPMAPKDAQGAELSKSTQRIMEIQAEQAREAQLELDRLALEAISAGVLDIETEEKWKSVVIDAPKDRLVAVLWGSKDCRKCKALKPRFVKLASDLVDNLRDTKFHYVDARSVGEARKLAGVKVVPLLQCWKNGALVDSFLAEGQIGEAEEKMKDLIIGLSSSK